MIKKKTASEVIAELKNKSHDFGDGNALEVGLNLLSNYDAQFAKQLEIGKDKYPKKNLYMEVHTLQPQSLGGYAFQWIMLARLTLPRPTFSQAVYRYFHITGNIELVWSLPGLEDCKDIDDNKHILDPSFQKLKEYVLSFQDGTLFDKSLLKYGEDYDRKRIYVDA